MPRGQKNSEAAGQKIPCYDRRGWFDQISSFALRLLLDLGRYV
jgi:hypothetical protein